jgi:hypothetical protein
MGAETIVDMQSPGELPFANDNELAVSTACSSRAAVKSKPKQSYVRQ